MYWAEMFAKRAEVLGGDVCDESGSVLGGDVCGESGSILVLGDACGERKCTGRKELLGGWPYGSDPCFSMPRGGGGRGTC